MFSGRQVGLALAIAGEAAAARAPLAATTLGRLAELVPAESVVFTEFDLGTHEVVDEAFAWPVEDAPGTAEALAELCHLNPLRDVDCWHAEEPLLLRDRLPRSARRRSAFYRQVLRPNGIEHELKVFLPAPPGRSRSVCFARGPGRDFSERHRDLLALLRPHLAAACIRADASAAAAAILTRRENEILDLVGEGLSNDAIAAKLFVSPATVRTHLNHVYEKLGVHSRTAAVAARRAAARA